MLLSVAEPGYCVDQGAAGFGNDAYASPSSEATNLALQSVAEPGIDRSRGDQMSELG